MSLSSRAEVVLDIVSTLVVTAAGGALLWTLYKGQGPSTPTAPGPRIESVSDMEMAADRATKRVGRASIATVEFSDFQCPCCGRHARETLPKIRSELIDTGKSTYVSLAFPLEEIHPDARAASEAAECAAQQGHVWQMHERLFSAPRGGLTVAHFSESAEAIGLDLTRFKKCLSGEAASVVAAEIAEGRRLEVNSTPVFFVGKIKDDGSTELMKRIKGAATFNDACVCAEHGALRWVQRSRSAPSRI